MPSSNPCRLIGKDFRILQTLLAARCGRNDLLEPLLREKLSAAEILQPQDLPPDVVTLYSRVRYRVDGRAATTRIVIHDAALETVGATLPITVPRGLALLGLAERQTATLPAAEGVPETIYIEKVVYQPQAAGRLAETLCAASLPEPGDLRP
jgi:regulator of nucleoside diphosphate kinase